MVKQRIFGFNPHTGELVKTIDVDTSILARGFSVTDFVCYRGFIVAIMSMHCDMIFIDTESGKEAGVASISKGSLNPYNVIQKPVCLRLIRDCSGREQILVGYASGEGASTAAIFSSS